MSLSDFFKYENALKDSILSRVHTMLPARVVSYNHETKLANIEILTRRKDKDNNDVDIPVIVDVPVSFTVANDFFISLPLKQGDIGRLCIFSTDISRYKKYGGKQNKVLKDYFGYHHSIFVPDLQPENVNMSSVSSGDNLVIGRIDNGLTISLTPDDEIIVSQAGNNKIKLSTDGTTNITPSDNLDVEINNSDEIKITQNGTEIISIDSSGNLSKEINSVTEEITTDESKTIGGSSTEIITTNKSITATNINLTGITSVTGATTLNGIVSTTGALTILGGIISSSLNVGKDTTATISDGGGNSHALKFEDGILTSYKINGVEQ